MLALAAGNAKADEGMWTLYNLPEAVYQQMKSYGFNRTLDGLYTGNNAIMKSVVNFSGFCSGIVVSPDGLVFTNHHSDSRQYAHTPQWSTTTCSTASTPSRLRKSCQTRTCS